jgi:hypothetical protein
VAYATPPNFTTGAIVTESQLDTLSDDITFLANPPKCRVYNSANISVATSGVVQYLTFNSERFDTDSMHSTAVNTGRITFTTAGTYLVGANVQFASNATGFRDCFIRRNGTTSVAYTRMANAGATVCIVPVQCVAAFSAGDYIEIGVQQSSGGALNVEAATEYSPEAWAIWQSL